MLNFVFVLTIIFEILITSFLVYKLNQAEKKVISMTQEIVFLGRAVSIINRKLNKNIKQINKVVSIFTNKKFIKIASILKTVVLVIQIIIFIKTIKSKGGFNLNFGKIKKLIYVQFLAKFFNLICKYL